MYPIVIIYFGESCSKLEAMWIAEFYQTLMLNFEVGIFYFIYLFIFFFSLFLLLFYFSEGDFDKVADSQDATQKSRRGNGMGGWVKRQGEKQGVGPWGPSVGHRIDFLALLKSDTADEGPLIFTKR